MNLLESGALIGRLPRVLEDHFELLQLECRYESEEGKKRFLMLTLTGLCLVGCMAFLHMALMYALWRSGIPVYAICLGLAVFWGGVGTLIFYRFGRRNPRVGDPFDASRSEIKKSLQWMQKHLS